jgi:hypothetical protein
MKNKLNQADTGRDSVVRPVAGEPLLKDADGQQVLEPATELGAGTPSVKTTSGLHQPGFGDDSKKCP